jgi:hypothetical protein
MPQPLAFTQPRKKKTNRQKISSRANTTPNPSPVATPRAGGPPVLRDLDGGRRTGAVTTLAPSTQDNEAAPQLRTTGPAAPSQSHPSEIVLPKVILNHLDYADAGPHVPRIVARCLQRHPGYECGNWRFILEQSGLSDLDINLLVAVMHSMVRDGDF